MGELYGWFVNRPNGGQAWYVYGPKDVIDITVPIWSVSSSSSNSPSVILVYETAP